jgi:hypothetical protein
MPCASQRLARVERFSPFALSSPRTGDTELSGGLSDDLARPQFDTKDLHAPRSFGFVVCIARRERSRGAAY